MGIKDIIKARKKQNKGKSWQQDRMMESQEPHEKAYKKKSSGLKYASAETRHRVSSLGGKARKHRRR